MAVFSTYQQRTGKDTRSVLATVKSFVATPSNMELPMGGMRQLKVAATYSNGTNVDVTNVSRFTSSDPTVALPDAGGLIYPKKPGRARITAAFEKFTAEASIIVKPQEHRSGSVEKKREP
jgi:uncharacterized protein YjdB